MIRLAILLSLYAAAFPAAARDLTLSFPIDCTLGDTCFIQNFVDADPGPGAADFTCNPLTYDGHKGTDISLLSLQDMQTGVSVLSTAPGHVRAIRDGEPDNGTPIEGRECGNGVLVDHGGGWQSQYCHMKQGSITVQPGQRVSIGTPLGQVGLSGNTEFPHLHFEMRHDDELIDPFNSDGITTCGPEPDDQLWTTEIAYQPGGIISTGMSLDIPTFDAIKAGNAAVAEAGPNAPALVVWAYMFGAREGDVLRLSITREVGLILITDDIELTKTQAQTFRAIGKRLPDGGWPIGVYNAKISLVRGGDILDHATTSLTVKPSN